MDPGDSDLVARALGFALDAHAGQTRKGRQVPYATHLLRVAALVMENGGDAVQTAAGLLHDTVEDCAGVTEAALQEQFGGDVARIVAGLTDTLPGDTPGRKAPWRERKEAYIRGLRDLDERGKLVAACDKLDNLRAVVEDLHHEGLATLERFTAKPQQTRWYYEQVRGALGGMPEGIAGEYDALLSELARYVPEASVEP